MTRKTAFLSAMLALMLTACSTPRTPALDARQVQRFEAQGYPPPRELATEPLDEVRLIGGSPARLVWLTPQDHESHPLLIYMPGLGQDAHALPHSRQQLAQAGYVVLSWQPLPKDETTPPPGDARAWAADRYAPAQLQHRSSLLAQLLTALKQAQAQGDPKLQQVDLGHVGLAGFDLGAYTVMHAAGEQLAATPLDAAAPTFDAYIAISPFASFDQGAFDTRYRQIKGAVLTVTSDNDIDTNGLVPAAYLRTAPFGGMPPGDKFMLVFKGSRHAALGEMMASDQSDTPDTADIPKHASGRSGKGGGRSRPGGEGGHAGSPGARQGQSPTSAAMQQVAQASVSVAFLDAYVRQDPLARQWLQAQAGHWLAPVGDWLSK